MTPARKRGLTATTPRRSSRLCPQGWVLAGQGHDLPWAMAAQDPSFTPSLQHLRSRTAWENAG
jgi:hypothetical protein